jgi:regulatory protein
MGTTTTAKGRKKPEAPAVELPEDERARAIALRQLSVTARTREHLRRAMSARGISDAVAQTVLDRLTDVGLVDDAAFARDYVAARRAARGSSQRALRVELQRKGVPTEVIDDVLDGTTRADERDLALALATKRWRSVAGLEPDVRRRRLASLLARRGYPQGLCFDVIREIEHTMAGASDIDDLIDLTEPD